MDFLTLGGRGRVFGDVDSLTCMSGCSSCAGRSTSSSVGSMSGVTLLLTRVRMDSLVRLMVEGVLGGNRPEVGGQDMLDGTGLATRSGLTGMLGSSIVCLVRFVLGVTGMDTDFFIETGASGVLEMAGTDINFFIGAGVSGVLEVVGTDIDFFIGAGPSGMLEVAGMGIDFLIEAGVSGIGCRALSWSLPGSGFTNCRYLKSFSLRTLWEQPEMARKVHRIILFLASDIVVQGHGDSRTCSN